LFQQTASIDRECPSQCIILIWIRVITANIPPLLISKDSKSLLECANQSQVQNCFLSIETKWLSKNKIHDYDKHPKSYMNNLACGRIAAASQVQRLTASAAVSFIAHPWAVAMFTPAKRSLMFNM
jgi:hypothetical protein